MKIKRYRISYFVLNLSLATTHFQPTDARRAFPCMDEPAMKAVFDMKMFREKNMQSYFNTPIERTINSVNPLYLNIFNFYYNQTKIEFIQFFNFFQFQL